MLDGLASADYKFHRGITATTRPSRSGERDGVHYYFKTVDEFQDLIRQGELLENAVVYDNYYGVPKQPLREALKRGEDVLLRVDVQGASSLKRILPNAIFVFVAPTNFEELVSRLENRATETPASLARRLDKYESEMRASLSFDYIIVNRENMLEDTIAKIRAIIIAEKCRVVQRYFQL
jgi:guanylate kinase